MILGFSDEGQESEFHPEPSTQNPKPKILNPKPSSEKEFGSWVLEKVGAAGLHETCACPGPQTLDGTLNPYT